MGYIPRVIDSVLQEHLNALGAVLIEGPRGCGKTSTGIQHARSVLRLDRSPELLDVASLDPQALLVGETPRLIDEWQLAPALWNAIRHEIDDRQARGQFILSGSATPAADITRHSGAGRFARIRMRPMALCESQQNSDAISLAELYSRKQVSGRSDVSYRELAELAVAGGWPASIGASNRQAILFNRAYIDNLCDAEVSDVSGVRHSPSHLRRLLQSLARNVASEVTLLNLAADVGGDSASSVDPKTISTYLAAFERVFALENLPAWSVALRSRSRLRSSAKIHLADPSLACAALGVGAERLAGDPEFFGQVFESMVVRDLRTLASVDGGNVFHYRDNTGLEVDVIVEYPDGRWGAIEVKLGVSRVPDAERSLLKLKNERVDTSRVGDPEFLAVVTGTEFAHTLPSGVHVIPLALLGV